MKQLIIETDFETAENIRKSEFLKNNGIVIRVNHCLDVSQVVIIAKRCKDFFWVGYHNGFEAGAKFGMNLKKGTNKSERQIGKCSLGSAAMAR